MSTIKVSALTAKTSPSGSEELLINDGGTSKKITIANLPAGGATGGGNDKVFMENELVVTTNYTLSTNKSAVSVGPVTINTGISVTVPTGHTWVVL